MRSLFLVLIACGAVAAAGPRTVVLIVADDHGRDLGCYGNRDAVTPHLDALAKDGTRFTHAFATTASCSPSRGVLLTGLHTHANGTLGLQHGYHHFASYPTVKSLPVILASNGYRTARIGKLHVGPDDVFPFDTVIPGPPRNPVRMAENCRAFLAAEPTKPAFLYFCGADPHRSGTAVPNDPLKPNDFGNGPKYPGVVDVPADPAKLTVPPFLPDSPAARAEWAQYLQAVNRFDQGVGKLIAVLKETKRYDDALILYLSDNGPPFPGAKTTVYDAGLHLPLIVRSPDAKSRGATSAAMVSWADITPTILDFAGATTVPGPPARPADVRPAKAPANPPPYTFHGTSFLATLDGKAVGRDEIYASHTFHEVTMYYPMRAVRTRTHKLIHNLAHPLPFPFASDLHAGATWQHALKNPAQAYGPRSLAQYLQRPEFELYDLAADPHEAKNLAADPAMRAVRAGLEAKLKAFRTATADPWVIKYEHE